MGMQGCPNDAGAIRARKGFHVIDLLRGDRPKHRFNTSGRKDHNKADDRIGQIAPGMGNALANADRSTSWEVLRLASNSYLKRAFNNDEVFLFMVMGVERHAYSWRRFDFQSQIRAAGVAGGSLDL